MSLRFIVTMLALTLITLGLAYSVIHGSGSSATAPAAPASGAPRSE
jgi:multidrug transporter EmrE-like cation transporter